MRRLAYSLTFAFVLLLAGSAAVLGGDIPGTPNTPGTIPANTVWLPVVNMGEEPPCQIQRIEYHWLPTTSGFRMTHWFYTIVNKIPPNPHDPNISLDDIMRWRYVISDTPDMRNPDMVYDSNGPGTGDLGGAMGDHATATYTYGSQLLESGKTYYVQSEIWCWPYGNKTNEFYDKGQLEFVAH